MTREFSSELQKLRQSVSGHLQQIADKANCNISTVSRILNGKWTSKKRDMEEKVLIAAKEVQKEVAIEKEMQQRKLERIIA